MLKQDARLITFLDVFIKLAWDPEQFQVVTIFCSQTVLGEAEPMGMANLLKTFTDFIGSFLQPVILLLLFLFMKRRSKIIYVAFDSYLLFNNTVYLV